jgi:hypothetical protein
MAVISSRHAARLLFQRLSNPSAEYLWLIIDSAYVTDLTPMRQFCVLTRRVNALVF